MIEFTNREIASVIVAVGVIIGLFMTPQIRTALGPSLRSFLKTLFNRHILTMLGIYFAYAALVVLGAWRLGVWDGSLLKDTVIITIFTGLPMLFRANKMISGMVLVGQTIKETLGVSALIVFYLGLYSFPIWGEIPLQIALGFLVFMAAGAAHQKDQATRRVGTVANVIIAGIVVWLTIQTAVALTSAWNPADVPKMLSTFALSVWLPLLLLPLIYSLAFYMSCEMILRSLTTFNDHTRPPLRVRLAVVLGLHFSTHLASSFIGKLRMDVAATTAFRDALKIMKAYRGADRKKVAAKRAHQKRLKKFAGVQGVDDQGRQLDRREFSATKQGLTHLFYNQKGQHGNRHGHFQANFELVYSDYYLSKVTPNSSVEMKVRKDKQAWYAWRRTVGGWYFGVGGTSDLDSQWQFDGPEPPRTFPSSHNEDWTNATKSESSLEWRTADDIQS